MSIVGKAIDGGNNIYKNFKNQMAKSRENIKNNYIKADETNLGDNNFFAFLDEWLKDLMKVKEENSLIDELKKNEALTKEKFQVILKDQLREYMKLDKDILKAKGLENLDYDKANKLLDNDNFMEFTSELLNNKFEKLNKFAETLKEKGKEAKQITETLQKQDLSIKAKDIQSLSAKAGNVMKDKNTQKAIAEGINIVRKVIMKV